VSDSPRYHSLDAVRACALLAGIVLHSTMSFWPGFCELNWPISDDSTSLTLAGTFFVLHIFRMSLFFAIAGFFAHLLLQKFGFGGFIRNRLRRIALPFVAALVLVSPLLIPSFLWGQKKLGLTGWPSIKPAIPDPQLPPWGYLWLLYLLLVLYAIRLATYHFWVRSTFVGRFLSGRKYPRGEALALAPGALASSSTTPRIP
jgi:glucan biosynthesis protein C